MEVKEEILKKILLNLGVEKEFTSKEKLMKVRTAKKVGLGNKRTFVK